jgi:hypothetical protein
LVGARGHERCVKLTEDDSLATLGWCTKKGDIGHWGSSAVQEANKEECEEECIGDKENCVCTDCIWERYRRDERE